jgi:hypothetical protein
MDVYITYLVLLAWELWDPIRTMQLAQSRRKQGTWGPEDQGPGDQGTRGLAGQGTRRLLEPGGQRGFFVEVKKLVKRWYFSNCYVPLSSANTVVSVDID